MKKLTLLLFSFRLSCLVTFIYQAWNSFDDYSEKRTLSDIGFIKQDRFPLPSICITTKKFSHVSFNSTFNVTHDEYKKGKWKAGGLSEKELWEALSPKLPQLIEKIELQKKIEIDGERKAKIVSSVENLSSSGVDIERKDYYKNPRIFCLTFRNLHTHPSRTSHSTKIESRKWYTTHIVRDFFGQTNLNVEFQGEIHLFGILSYIKIE